MAFPRTQGCHAERLGEQQLIASTRYNPTPAFDLLGSAQMRLGPEQILLEEAIAMLLGEALAIPGADLCQGHILFAKPDEPTLARITLGVTGSFPQHADHPDFGLGCLAEMQVLPTRDDHALAVLIDPFPLGIGRPVGLGAAALKEWAMFAWGPTLLGLAFRLTVPVRVAVPVPAPVGETAAVLVAVEVG